MEILVIDIGGTHVKFKAWGRRRDKANFVSGDHLSATQVVKRILAETQDWKYDAVSVGFPGSVIHGRIKRASRNLGRGWVHLDFEKHFRKPVKVMNDAAMQAIGSYRGGRMLFLGLGTGVGSALILDDVIVPLELSHLDYTRKKTVGDMLGKQGLIRAGPKEWENAVHQIVERLSLAFQTDYVVIGGGNVKRLKRLPRGARRGDNDNAFIGGARLWGRAGVRAHPRKHTWVIA
jgi:predicted NBD/HSP70 family sugar kinase